MRLIVLCLLSLLLGCASRMLPAAFPRLGESPARFVWDEAWSAQPWSAELGNTHGGMAVDRAGRVYASRDAAPAVLVFDRKGQQVDAWGEELAGGLHGLCLVQEGAEEFLYLAHTARHQVWKTTLTGEVLWKLDLPTDTDLYDDASQYHPTSVAVAPDGRLFVADGYGKGYIHRFAADRSYLGSFGGPGDAPGLFHTPHGLAVDATGAAPRLLVADRENGRVQSFDLDGKFLEILEVSFRRPCGVAVGPGGRLAVPELAGRVTLLDGEDRLLARLGDNPDSTQWAQNGLPVEAWQAGVFISPHGAAFDARGDLYVQDWLAAGRYTRLVLED